MPSKLKEAISKQCNFFITKQNFLSLQHNFYYLTGPERKSKLYSQNKQIATMDFISLVKRFSIDGRDYQEIPEDEESGSRNQKCSGCRRISLAGGLVFLAVIFGVSLVFVAVGQSHQTEKKGGNGAGYSDPHEKFVDGVNPSDFIPSIPLFGTPPSPQWSGLLNASTSTPGTYLHYWFAHYDREGGFVDGGKNRMSLDTSIPVVLWFNGGPGSSSVFGWLSELGPLILESDGKGLMENPYSWTKTAHVFALESPAGVGYSFCKNWTLPEKQACVNTDKTTARDAHAAIKDFFISKFPMLKENPFYITGESYAGIYVPTLAKEILDENDEQRKVAANRHLKKHINLQGVAVGDPCTDNKDQAQAFDMMWYSHKYGFITDDLYATLKDECGLVTPAKLTSGKYYGDHEKSAQAHRERQQKALHKHLDHISTHHGRQLDYDEDEDPPLDKKCQLAYRKFLVASSMGIGQEFAEAYINPYALIEKVDRTYDSALFHYMNREDVQKVMHVDLKITPTWYGDADDSGLPWEYYGSYDACNDQPLPEGTWSMIDFYRNIAPRLNRTVVYNGDSDPCVSYEGTRNAIEHVGFTLLEGGDYRPWFYNASAASAEVILNKPLTWGSMLSAQDGGPQFAGHTIDYIHNLSYVSVHGSGHMVPTNRPQTSLHLLRKVLTGGVFSPLLIDDEEMDNMNSTEFRAYVSGWTKGAMNYSQIHDLVSVDKKG